MKKYLFIAASALALASCSSDDFLGENPGNLQNASNAINFSGDAGKITRATSNEGEDYVKLDKQFKVYGVKTTDGTMFHNVFINYSVWYDENLTTSNTNKWEYVGKNNQTIKYWDYSASEYRFVAGSPINAFNFIQSTDNTGTIINSAKISGLAGHIEKNDVGGAGTALETNPVYVAKPKIVTKDNYKEAVKFEFVRQQAMVRVGLYETIPGYSITDIKFYAYDTDGTTLKVSTDNNVILTSAKANYFVGGSDVKGTINYDWTSETPSYTFNYTDDANLTKSQNWYAGKLCTTKDLAKTSTDDVDKLYGTDKDMSTTTGYFTVLPTKEAAASPILIKCDYELVSDDGSSEVINVTGATAAIPAAFSKWEANTRYTYLFKISQNTNGTTGKPGVNPEGLYPITFDAVVKDVEQGTTTTVATPSITTYQEGSVTDKGIEYNTGKDIYATVAKQDDGTLNELKTNSTEIGNVQVYKLTTERTEADLQIEAIANAEFIGGNKITPEVPTADTTVGNVTLDANKHLSFKPTAAGWYAIQYKYADGAYKYKVVYVKAAATPAP